MLNYLLLGIIVALVAVGLMALVACVLSSRISRREELPGPDSFEITGFDTAPHTVQRRPVRDPLPDPVDAPGEDLSLPGISSHLPRGTR